MSGHPALASLLGWLAVWPWLSSGQLAVLQNQDPETVRRQVRRAQDQGWVQVISSGSPNLPREQLYALTDAGLAVLAQARGTTPQAVARSCGLNQAALYEIVNRLYLIYPVRTLILGLVAHARRAGDEVLAGQTFVRRTFRRGKARTERVFCADAYVAYRHQNAIYPFFLLYDGGGLPLENLRDAVAAYINFRESKCYSGPYYAFPALVGVLADQDRLTELRLRGLGLGRRLHTPPPHLVLTTQAELWAAPTPLAAIWRAGESYNSVHNVPLLKALRGIPVESPATGPTRLAPEVFLSAAVATGRDQPAPPAEPGSAVLPSTLKGTSARPVHILKTPLAERSQDARRQERLRGARQTVLEESAALLNVSLTPAVQGVLNLISRIYYLTVTQIAAISGLDDSLAYKYLRQLKEQEMVLEWMPAGVSIPLYYPAALTVYRLARQQGETARRAVRRYQDHPAPDRHRLARDSTLAHTLGVRGFIAHCYEAARQNDGEMLTWRGEEECEQRFVVNGQVKYLCPDGWGRVRLGDTAWPFYLEWDHGSRNARDYREKFATHYAFRSICTSYVLSQEFPTVLVVTTAPDAMNRIRAAVRMDAAQRREPSLPLRITTYEALNCAGLWGAIWWSALEGSAPTVPFG